MTLFTSLYFARLARFVYMCSSRGATIPRNTLSTFRFSWPLFILVSRLTRSIDRRYTLGAVRRSFPFVRSRRRVTYIRRLITFRKTAGPALWSAPFLYLRPLSFRDTGIFSSGCNPFYFSFTTHETRHSDRLSVAHEQQAWVDVVVIDRASFRSLANANKHHSFRHSERTDTQRERARCC